MRRSVVLFWTACLGCLLSAPGRAGAEFIAWKYNWSRSPDKIMADAPGASYVTLTDEKLSDASGDTDVVATNLRVVSDAPPSSPDKFTNKGYSLTMYLLDMESGQEGRMTFTGLLNGTVSRLNTSLKNTFTGLQTQELLLGAHRYTVTIGPYTPPGPPDSPKAGAIGAYAQVRVTDIQKTPEPSTLALACAALPLLGVWRKRRR
jgi:PEP-CTERM motif